MITPDFHDDLAPGTADAILRVREISTWFYHVNEVQPRLKKLRYDALHRLKAEGMSHAQIAVATGMSKNRVDSLFADANASNRQGLIRSDVP